MSERDFEIGGRSFKLNKINALKQFHIVRRIGPILSDLLPALAEIQHVQNESISESQKLEEFAKIASPLMSGLSKLSDKDADYVLYGLLASVEMQQSTGNWMKIANGELLMAQDMDLAVLLQIAGKAFAFNLQGFFAALPRQS